MFPTDPVGAAREASRRIIRELGFLQDRFVEGGVSHAECHALIELGKHRRCTVGELAEILRLDKSTVSRTVSRLAAAGYVTTATDAKDARRKPFALTASGKRRLAMIDRSAGGRVNEALAALGEVDRSAAIRGLELYARALERSRLRAELSIRPIQSADDPAVAALIRTVMPEFGAKGPGFAINDPEVDNMSAAYGGKRSAYWVVERGGRVVGAGGFAPLEGGAKDTCELRKMYFYSEVRGLGIGEMLIDLALTSAKRAGFKRCYLETLENMTAARRLYEKKGFVPLCAPKGKTGHFGCDAFYERVL
ncbi:MAG: MarR family transcriptional regulator [Polyangiaceae bacterium]|nr:MarR family transcriptional regulator [Polyangiaceae bacterium]